MIAPFDLTGPLYGLCEILGPFLLTLVLGPCGSGVWLPIIAPPIRTGPFPGLCDAFGTCELLVVLV